MYVLLESKLRVRSIKRGMTGSHCNGGGISVNCFLHIHMY